MKKIFLILIIIITLTGCTLGNTPTAKVEDLLTKYQMLDNDIEVDYTTLIGDISLNEEQIKTYNNIIKKQYKNLTYEVKEEEIDGNNAIVTIQIEVKNYKNTINKYNKQDYETTKYHELVTKSLDTTKEMITYTLDITLTKDNNDIWILDPLTEENKDKLIGIY